MLLKKITKHEFSLCLAVRLHVIVDRYIDCLIEVFRQFLSASCFNGFFYLRDYISLGKYGRKGRNRHPKNQRKAKNSLLHDGFYNGQNYATPLKIIKISGVPFCKRFLAAVIFPVGQILSPPRTTKSSLYLRPQT